MGYGASGADPDALGVRFANSTLGAKRFFCETNPGVWAPEGRQDALGVRFANSTSTRGAQKFFAKRSHFVVSSLTARDYVVTSGKVPHLGAPG